MKKSDTRETEQKLFPMCAEHDSSSVFVQVC